MKPSTLATARRNLKFTILESALTRGLLCMSIMTPFFNSIGLDQLQISKSQIIFTIVMLILNVPTGWIAVRTFGSFGYLCPARILYYCSFQEGINASPRLISRGFSNYRTKITP